MASLDDRWNVLGASSLPDRFAVLSVVMDALPRLMDAAVAKKRRRAFVNWASLSMLSELRRQTHTGWGAGTLGYAEAVSRKAENPVSRKAPRKPAKVEARRPRLMLNLLDPDLVLPEFRRLNLAREVAALQGELLDIVFNEEVRIPSTAMQEAVRQGLADPQIAVLVRAVLPSGALWSRPGSAAVKGPSLARAIPQILGYYGIGRACRCHRTRMVALVPWRLHVVLDRIAKERTLDLASLPWMEGRYLLRAGSRRGGDRPAEG